MYLEDIALRNNGVASGESVIREHAMIKNSYSEYLSYLVGRESQCTTHR